MPPLPKPSVEVVANPLSRRIKVLVLMVRLPAFPVVGLGLVAVTTIDAVNSIESETFRMMSPPFAEPAVEVCKNAPLRAIN